MMRRWIVTTTKKFMDHSWNFGFSIWRGAVVAALAVMMAATATSHDMSDDDEIKTEDELKGLTAFGSNDNVRTAFGTSDIPSGQRHDPERIFTSVEQMPEFPGGQAALMGFLSENIIYPAEAAESGKEGLVVVQFVVEKDGSVGVVKVVRGVDPLLDAEAVRVCKSLPLFKPGRQNGQPIRVWFTLPITFKLSAPEPAENNRQSRGLD